jgi:predicted RND superfamily exporter protein
MESTLEPFIFLIGIFFAVMYNLGTNVFMKDISYITKSIAGVLQLGVTMDYSIFLLNRYDEEKQRCSDRREAMAQAVKNTFAALSGSSLTTIAGFLALCFMKLSIGKDIGIVMAKGVIIGVLCVVTILPALVLVFDKPLHKYRHRTILPEFGKTTDFLVNKYKIFAIIFLLAFLPALYGQNHTKVYYNLDESLPKNLDSIVATNKLKSEYDMATTHFIIVKDDIKPYKVKEMVQRIEKVDGVDKVLAYDKFIGPMIPESFIPQEIKDIFKKDGYQIIMANSKYKAARDEENAQIDEITKIVKSYDKEAMVAGEGPLTKDLIEIADTDFEVTSYISIAAIFAIVLFVFKSISVPVILVAAIELAIFINMAVPFFTGTIIPFIASIVIGCVQLGATVDYAILMTSRFQEELSNCTDRFEAMKIAARTSDKSIITSALVFFCATGGVALISRIEMIKSLCAMLARGSLISAAVIIFVLPSLLLIFENAISRTSLGWRKNVQI